MSHQTRGTYAVARFSDEERDALIGKLQESGCNIEFTNDGKNINIVGNSEDFDVARAMYNQAVARQVRENPDVLERPMLATDKYHEERIKSAKERNIGGTKDQIPVGAADNNEMHNSPPTDDAGNVVEQSSAVDPGSIPQPVEQVGTDQVVAPQQPTPPAPAWPQTQQ